MKCTSPYPIAHSLDGKNKESADLQQYLVEMPSLEDLSNQIDPSFLDRLMLPVVSACMSGIAKEAMTAWLTSAHLRQDSPHSQQ